MNKEINPNESQDVVTQPASQEPAETKVKAKRKGRPAKESDQIDWEGLRIDYSAGILSFRALSDKYKVSVGAIHKRAKRDEWTRNLQAKIAERLQAKVNNAAVNAEVNNPARLLTFDERVVVEAVADLQFTILETQRADIRAHRSLAQKLLDEVVKITDCPEMFQEIAELKDESGPNANGTWVEDKVNKIYRHVISLSGRVENAKKLSDVLTNLIKLERQAYGIKEDDEGGERGGIDDTLAAILGKKGHATQ